MTLVTLYPLWKSARSQLEFMETLIPIASFQDKDVQYANHVTKRDHLNTSILQHEAYSLLRVSYMNLN